MAAGNGEGGAGHRPRLAAAFSTRLSVCRCSAACDFLRERRDELEDAEGIVGIDVEDGGGCRGLAGTGFAGTRGGVGVRNVGEKKSPMSSNPEADFFGVSKAWFETLGAKREELEDASELGFSAVAEDGEAWKSAKSSSSNDARLEVGTADEARAGPDGGGGGGNEKGDMFGAAVWDLAAEGMASIRCGHFAIGGGIGGDGLDADSTGDWKSEKSSSSNKLDVNGTADGEVMGRF